MNKIFYILFLTLITANNAPVWLDIPEQIIEEDCNSCTGFPFNLEPYVSDVDGDDLIISIPEDIEGATFTVDGFILDIIVDENWYGPIDFDVTAFDGIDSSYTGFSVDVTSINDPPYFTPIGDGNITIEEEQVYNQQWTSIISTGAYNENEDTFFNLNFTNDNLFEIDSITGLIIEPTLSPQGIMNIKLADDSTGTSDFTVRITDTGEGFLNYEETYTLIVSPVNDPPDWTDIPEQIIEEDCNPCAGFPFDLEPYVSDVDHDNDDLIISIPEDIEGATVSINGFLLDVIPNQDFNGSIEIDLIVSDGMDTKDQIFTLIVSSINDAPVWTDIPVQTIEEDCDSCAGFPLDLEPYVSDIDGDDLTITIPDNIEGATFTVDGFLLYVEPNLDFNTEEFDSIIFNLTVSDDIDSAINAFTLEITPINDLPGWIDIPIQTIEEDCDPCAGFPFDLSPYVSDVDNDNDDLTIVSGNAQGATFSINEYEIDVELDDNFFGLINLNLQASDNDTSSSTVFVIDVTSINDPPYFTPIGDGNIIMYEDSIYIEKWIQQISPGNEYESDNMDFILEFDDQELVKIDSDSTFLSTIDSIFKITPELNANGETSFTVQLSDDGENNNGGNNLSDIFSYTLTIKSVNDAPSIFNIPSNPLIIDEDSEPFSSAYFVVKPGGGDGRFKETDDNFTFEIINDYDTDLFIIDTLNNIFPDIQIDQSNNNVGVLSFSLAENYNGNTDFLVRVYDDGASSEDPFNNSLFFDTTLNVQINQINDYPIEFHNIPELYNYQIDLSTFIGDTTFRFPYQEFYTSNQLANKMRFKWQNKPDLDVDLDPSINKDYTMDSLYYYLQMYNEFETINLDTITYQNPLSLDTVVVDIDLTLDQYDIDLSGNTLYSFRVLAKNDQIDSISFSDPITISTDATNYSFSIDLTLPTLDMNYLHDDIFIEHFDLYMQASENFVDFDNFNRPLKLWIYYNSIESQPDILFPDLKDTLNNIYYSSYDFKYPGDISFIHQMRDRAANINQDSLNVSFGIIDPASPSYISFDNNIIQLTFPLNSVNNSIPCLISEIDIDIDNSLDIIGYPIKIYPANIELIKSAIISFDLSIIPDYYDLNHCGLYYYDNNNWILSDTYIEDNKLKSKINNFGSYAIFYNENQETLSFPDQYILMQNHPNPFNPETMINFYIPEDNYVEVNIYSIKGEKVKTIYKGEIDSGYQSIRWNGKNDSDTPLSSGIYIISLNYDDRTINSKMVKLK